MFELSDIKVTRPYEAIIMVHPDATEQEQKDLFKKNKSIIESFSGEVNHIDTWGKRKLANSIKKMNRALYFHTTFTASTDAIAELERTMKINDRVIRVVHTRLSEKIPLAKHLERFKDQLAEALRKEKEKEGQI